MLELRMANVVSASTFDWQLTDEAGSLLATQSVHLDPASDRHRRATNLYRETWRIDTDPVWAGRSSRLVLESAGAYVGREVLGVVCQAMMERAPTSVRMVVTVKALGILALPFELAHRGGPSLKDSGVTLVYSPVRRAESAPAEPPDTIRVLAVFALPVDSSALALARERRQLTRRLAAYGDRVQLRVLQYGATRAALQAAVQEPAGWDIVHLAGHGSAGRFHLEKENGQRDLIRADELLAILGSATRNPQLVMALACESGFVQAIRHPGAALAPGRLSRLRSQAEDVRGHPTSTSLGYELARRLQCAVVAMRYPVEDGFSIEFSQGLYHHLLTRGRPIEDATAEAVASASINRPESALSDVTPILFDGSFAGTVLPSLAEASTPPPEHRSTLPDPPELFVGRVDVLSAIVSWFTASDSGSSLALVGMPGIGKSATLLEAAHSLGSCFDRVVWVRWPAEHGPSDFLQAWTTANTDAGSAATAENGTASTRRLLLVVDDIQHALDRDGGWKSDSIATVFTELLTRESGTRVLFGSDRPIQGMTQIVLPFLSSSEAELLTRQARERNADLEPLALTSTFAWLVCRGHPGLIVRFATGSVTDVHQWTRQRAHEWGLLTPAYRAQQADADIAGGSHPGAALQQWAKERDAALPPGGQLVWRFIACLEPSDRRTDLIALLLPILAQFLGLSTGGLDEAIGAVLTQGLMQKHARGTSFLMHPAVSLAGRQANSAHELTVVVLLSQFWCNQHDGGSETDTGEATLAQFAASAVPYLIREGSWEEASKRCEEAINHDTSPTMAGRLSPFLEQIVAATTATAIGLATRYVHATVAMHLDPGKATIEMRRTFDEALDDGNQEVVFAAGSSLGERLSRSNPAEALKLLDQAAGALDPDRIGPWAALAMRLKTAEIRDRLDLANGAVAEAEQLVHEVDGLEMGVTPVWVNRRSVRLEVLEFAASAAARSGDTTRANTLRMRVMAELSASGAASRDLIRAQLNDVLAQVHQGAADSSADDRVVAALGYYDSMSNSERGIALMLKARLEVRRGNYSESAELGRRALRATYSTGATIDAAQDHHAFAVLLAENRSDDNAAEIAAHLLAYAVIELRVSRGALVFIQNHPAGAALMMVSMRLARDPNYFPQTYPQLCEKLHDTAGVDLDALIASIDRVPVSFDVERNDVALRFNAPDPDGDSVSDVLLWAAHKPPPADLLDVANHPEHWADIVAAIVNAVRRGVDESVSTMIGNLRAAGWSNLSDALDRILRGEPPTKGGVLDDTDAAVVAKIREELSVALP